MLSVIWKHLSVTSESNFSPGDMVLLWEASNPEHAREALEDSIIDVLLLLYNMHDAKAVEAVLSDLRIEDAGTLEDIHGFVESMIRDVLKRKKILTEKEYDIVKDCAHLDFFKFSAADKKSLEKMKIKFEGK